MDRHAAVNFVITAAVVLVVLPLLIAIATFGAHFGLQLAGGEGLGIFGHMGGVHVVGLSWTVLAVAVVGALIALLMKETMHHA